jgi:hypothetical protein
MHHLDDESERALTLLTRMAFGNVALVRDALAKHGDDSLDAIVRYIQTHRDPKLRPSPRSKALQFG